MDLLADPRKRRWLGWGILCAAYFLASLHRISTAVMAEDLMRAFDTTGAGLGFLHSSFFYLYALLQLPAGVLTDQFGARRTGALGTTLMSLGAVTFGLSPTYLVAFGGRLLMGLGASVLILTILRFAANWFRPDEFATIAGLSFAVGILGGITATTPLAVAVTTVGWRPTLLAVGGVGFAVALGIHLLAHNTPEAAGLEPLSDVPSSPAASLADLRRYAGVAVRQPVTWLMSIMMFLSIGTSFTIFGLWGIPYLSQLYGISITEASLYLLVGSVGGLFGSPVFGWVSDRLGRRTELIVVSTVSFTAAWAFIAIFVTPPLLLVGVVFFLSRLLRGGTGLVFTVMKERHPEDASATVQGLVNEIGWIGAAVFPPLIGAVLDVYWTGETVAGARVYTAAGYRVGFGIAAVAGVIAVGCAVWAHVRVNRTPVALGERAALDPGPGEGP